VLGWLDNAVKSGVAARKRVARHRDGGQVPRHNQQPAERSRVRIFFVEGDFAPGDLRELTETLSSAIRPTRIAPRTAPHQLAAPAEGHLQVEENLPDLEPADLSSNGGEEAPARAQRGQGKKRAYRKPQVVAMKMVGDDGTAFESFANEHHPDDHLSRYLVAAAWLQEHAKVDPVTVDHIYTCYKALDWAFDVTDPGSAFRKLKRDGLGTLKAGDFSINHIGLATVQKMRPSA
jgi:hypothetical protein